MFPYKGLEIETKVLEIDDVADFDIKDYFNEAH
jgi:hypothetical protein